MPLTQSITLIQMRRDVWNQFQRGNGMQQSCAGDDQHDDWEAHHYRKQTEGVDQAKHVDSGAGVPHGHYPCERIMLPIRALAGVVQNFFAILTAAKIPEKKAAPAGGAASN